MHEIDMILVTLLRWRRDEREGILVLKAAAAIEDEKLRALD